MTSSVRVVGDDVLGLACIPAPGHASHQVSYLHDDGTLYNGDALGVQLAPAPARLGGVADPLQRVLGQQLQDADVVPCPRLRPVPLLQRPPPARERFGQLPVAQHRGVVQRRHALKRGRAISPQPESLRGEAWKRNSRT